MSSALLSSATSSAGARPGAGLSEDDPRFRVAAARRILARGGCESGVAGHVSLRADDGNSFWTSAFEYFDETTPATVVRADFDLQLIEGTSAPSPAIEFHSAIYRSRSDVGAVIHIHSHWVSTFVSGDGPIGMYNVGAVVFHEEQAMLVDDGTRPPVEGHRVVAALAGRSVVLSKNHGAIVVASTLETATVLALMLEQAARYHIEAVAFGGTEIPVAEVVRGKASYHRYFVPEMWAANYRRLARTDSDLMAWLDT